MLLYKCKCTQFWFIFLQIKIIVTDRKQQCQTDHPGYHMMTPYMQRKIVKIMCVVEKKCYINIVNLLNVLF